jgi:type IV pilus assembly protein PilB
MANEETHYSDGLLQLVAEKDLVSPEQAAEIENERQDTGKPVRNILLDMGLTPEADLLGVIAEHLGSRVVNLPATDIPTDVVRAVPASVARMYNAVPVAATTNSVELAVYDWISPQIMDELAFVLSRDVSFVLAREEDVTTYINQFYGDDSETVKEMLLAMESEFDSGAMPALADEEENVKSLEEAAGSTPVIRFVHLVLYQAVNDRASDIHFEPFEKEFKIRYRVDGALYEMMPPPKRLALPIISRIKVLANLNIAERRLPQDGRIQLSIGGRLIDMRVSTLPTQFGESVVLRVLDKSVVSLDIENLGMPDDVRESYLRDITKPNGIVIVTGPTGSGKTTTLYSGLRRLNKTERKVLTAEDPVEYEIEGIVQVPIVHATGNTFAKVLRAFLRQDPDVMMVGEIRDLETAQTAVQAALTGHLVFSTLHTNDAAGGITRLIDMGVEPYLISSTVEAILAQRLVRVICDQCKQAYKPDEEILQQLNLTEEDVGDRMFHYGAGCPRCSSNGYFGRRGIYEYLAMSEPVRMLVNDRQPTLSIRNRAIELGMRTLREDGIRNLLDGHTTVEEVIKYT